MQPAGSLRLPRQANRRDDLVLHRASARPVLGRRTAGCSAFRQRSRLGRMEVMFLLCRKCGTLGDAVECSHFESIVMISATALVVIACSILFFCTSVATASNFTPVKSGALRCSGVALRRRLLATSPLILERRRIAQSQGCGLRRFSRRDYSRDLQLAKWGAQIQNPLLSP